MNPENPINPFNPGSDISLDIFFISVIIILEMPEYFLNWLVLRKKLGTAPEIGGTSPLTSKS